MKTLLKRAAVGLLAALLCATSAQAQTKPVAAPSNIVPMQAAAYADGSGNAVTVNDANGLPVRCMFGCGGGGGGGGGDASAANQVITNNRIGDLVVSPAQYSLADRLKTINATLGSPFQVGGSIGNTAFGISGTLPAFGATPTFNLGTLNGAATAANQTTLNTSAGVISDAAYAGSGDTSIIGALKGVYGRANALLGYYKTEDAVHASGDNGLMALAVRSANFYSTTTSSAAGDYDALHTDPSGNLLVAKSDGAPITVTPLTATGVLFSVDTLGWDSVAFQTTGTWVGSVVYEGSDDTTNWVPTNVYNAVGGTVSSQTNSTNNSLYSYVAQHRYFRARGSVYTSGTITASAYLRTGPPPGYSNASSDALLTSILAKIIAAPATESTLGAVLAKQKGPLTFTQTAGSPFTLTSSWAKVATTTAATKGLIVAPSANASAFDIEWTSVTAGAAAPTDLYGVPVGYGETFADGLPIGDVYLKSATGMVATVRTGS